jgi:protein-L-isoaspartate(D-aspartate) O-methyltransferase
MLNCGAEHPPERRETPLRAALPLLLILLALTAAAPVAAREDAFAPQRAAMVTAIEANAEAVGSIDGRSGISPEVLEVMGKVPRHLFVPDALRGMAYLDRPLPIGSGQTISQPYIVALMTDLLRLPPDAVVLEVGTGSGYQAAVLAELAARVYSIEIVPELATSAAAALSRLGYDTVTVRAGDGYEGWPDAAPFDGIMVTAGAPYIPASLVEQLKPGGRMVIPEGETLAVQQLVLVQKQEDGTVVKERLLPVRFVPFTRAR